MKYKILHWLYGQFSSYRKTLVGKSKSEESCSFCKSKVETIEHISTFYPTVLATWNRIYFIYISSIYNYLCSNKTKTILFFKRCLVIVIMVTLLNCSYAHEKFSTIKKFTISVCDDFILYNWNCYYHLQFAFKWAWNVHFANLSSVTIATGPCKNPLRILFHQRVSKSKIWRKPVTMRGQ